MTDPIEVMARTICQGCVESSHYCKYPECSCERPAVAARLALAALAAAGLKVLPREPSSEMEALGNEEAETCIKIDPCGRAGRHVWMAMWEAA